MENVPSQNRQPSRHGPFAYDPYAAFIKVGIENVLTYAGIAASCYVEGNISRGEDLHLQAELAYTRVAMHLSCFKSRTDASAPEEHLNRAHAALDQLWLLHRTAA